MRQMRAPQAPAIGREILGTIEFGFMRDHEGRVFFLSAYGRETICLAVLEDGTIMPGTNDFPWPDQEIILVDPKELGITEIKYAPEGTRITR